MTAPASKPHYFYIDCIRGYAVLMVITSHYLYQFPNVPYPVHRVLVSGWFGVQLFFIASSLTLLMSWDHEQRTGGRANWPAFFIRRFFRIAPAYYVAGLFYFFDAPPPHGFDPVQLAAGATFLNNWNPGLMPVLLSRWNPFPGGWSVSVEFTFYAVFPWFVSVAGSARKVIFFILAALAVGAVANRLALTAMAAAYPPVQLRNFLFFWFPGQASVFGFGALVFLAIRRFPPTPWTARLLAISACIAFVVLAFVPLGHFPGDGLRIPSVAAVCPPLALFVYALSGLPPGLLVNRFAAAMGRVSFSAYLLHFAVLGWLDRFAGRLGAGATGYAAIAAFVVAWWVAVLLTFAAAWGVWRMIERPGIAFGSRLIRRRAARQLRSPPISLTMS